MCPLVNISTHFYCVYLCLKKHLYRSYLKVFTNSNTETMSQHLLFYFFLLMIGHIFLALMYLVGFNFMLFIIMKRTRETLQAFFVFYHGQEDRCRVKHPFNQLEIELGNGWVAGFVKLCRCLACSCSLNVILWFSDWKACELFLSSVSPEKTARDPTPCLQVPSPAPKPPFLGNFKK